MPRGRGWGQYVGARSLKCFMLDRAVALCETEVTALRDEHGRGGIRRTEVEVMSLKDARSTLKQRLTTLPEPQRSALDRLPNFGQKMAIANKTMPKPRRAQRLVLLAAYRDPASWRLIEALTIKLALYPSGPMRRWGRLIPFTTLALSHHDELPLVALPDDLSGPIERGTPVLRL